MPFVKEKTNNDTCFVDKDRDLSFRYTKATGGSSEQLEVYELRRKNEVITAVVEPKVIGKTVVEYEIRQLTMPKECHSELDQIVDLISEALDAYGYMGRRDWLETVSVSLSPEIHIQ